MNNNTAIILLFLIFTIIACTTNQSQKIHDKKVTIETKTAPNSKYLTQNELSRFRDNISPININSKLSVPFDTLQFDKVIAYDFEGLSEVSQSVINKQTGAFSNGISYQKVVDPENVEFLVEFLTNTKTYGESVAACFEPHLGIVFFKKSKVVYVIDVCLDCNFLISTTEIPATQFKKVKYEDGSEYGLKGFSKFGQTKIIELSKRLGLGYGKFEKK